MIYSTGLRIYTTMDSRIQNILDEEFGFSLGMTPELASAYICEKLNIG